MRRSREVDIPTYSLCSSSYCIVVVVIVIVIVIPFM
jgi:hypothetical protein